MRYDYSLIMASLVFASGREFRSIRPLKEFGRVIQISVMLKYFDDVELRQTIEKQLNKGELANKFSGAISFADQNILEAHSEDQEISVMCRTIIQNIIILWNYCIFHPIPITDSSDADHEFHLMPITDSTLSRSNKSKM
jgi:TnpA family transposase